MVVGHRCLFVVLRFRRGTSFWHNCSDRVKLRFKTIHFSAIVNWTNCKLSMLVPVPDDACDVDQEVDLHRERIAEGCAGRAQRCASFFLFVKFMSPEKVWQIFQGDLDQPWRDLRGERSLCHWHRCGRAGPKSDQVGSSRQKRENCENCVFHLSFLGPRSHQWLTCPQSWTRMEWLVEWTVGMNCLTQFCVRGANSKSKSNAILKNLTFTWPRKRVMWI